MPSSTKVSITLTAAQIRQVRDIVRQGRFSSSDAVIREALNAWLLGQAEPARRPLDRPRRSFADIWRERHPDPFERVELLFDAGDAKA